MDKVFKWLPVANFGVLLVIALVLVGNQSADSLGGTTSDDWHIKKTLTVDGASTLTGAVTISGALSVATTTSEVFTQGGTVLATTSAVAMSAYTLTQSELSANNSIEWINNLNITLTLPATSTLTTIVPNAGDVRQYFFQNASTTGAATITFAAGTGIDLQFAEATGGDLVLNGLDWAKITFIRQSDTDVTVIFDEMTEAD